MFIAALIYFGLGATSTAVLMSSEEHRKKVRPVVTTAIKKGIVASREVRRRVAGLMEDLDDLMAEAANEEAPVPGAPAHAESAPPVEGASTNASSKEL